MGVPQLRREGCDRFLKSGQRGGRHRSTPIVLLLVYAFLIGNTGPGITRVTGGFPLSRATRVLFFAWLEVFIRLTLIILEAVRCGGPTHSGVCHTP